MDISFYNLGCKVNLADISRIAKQFEELGHNVVDFEEKSDIVLVNTCTVTHRADADCRKIVRRALRRSPNAFVGVLGCYAQLQPEQLAKIEGVDAVIGTKHKFEIPNLIENFNKNAKTEIFVSDLDDAPFHTSAVSDNSGRTRAVLKIQDGCDYHCSFCTIPLARGNSRSMPYDQIEEEMQGLINDGYREVVLSGINLGDYKTDDGKKFVDALKLIDEKSGDMRIRISSIEPNLLTEEVLEVVANSKNIVPHFHIPLQSGSQELLRMMKRRYKATYYHDLVLRIKEVMPHCCIGVDVIVGFPGETDELAKETYDFLNGLPITYLHVFTYSERENTKAINYDGVVPHDVRKERTHQLRNLSDKKRLEFDESQVGTERVVIPEMYNEQNGMWRGWTENYVNVIFPASEDLPQVPHKIQINNMIESRVFGELTELRTEVKRTPNKRFKLPVIG
ncbi:MAG: tRNA (N(6)-L-threonylcarbamoyladenosine(37)-C(2))-methylthiotransferase MtaB [Candidatus Kapaibacterium sp.]